MSNDSVLTPDVVDGRRARIGWPEVGVAVLAAAVLYGLGIALILSVPDSPVWLPGLVQYAVSGLAPLGAFAAVLWLRVHDVRVFGVRRVAPRWLLISVALGLGVVVLNIALTVLVVVLTGPPSNLQADYQASAAAGGLAFVAVLALGAVLTPIGEEFLFRGVLTNALARYGPWVAVLGSSAIFALAHGINYILPVAFVVGVVAALLLRRTGSIWPGVIVHAVNNAYSLIVPAILGVAS